MLTRRARSGCGDHFEGCGLGHQVLEVVLPTPDHDFKFSTITAENQSTRVRGDQQWSQLSRMCCFFFTQRVTQVRNVDGGWSLQARGADDAHLHVDADLHGSGADLHGAGNGGHTHTLVEMVILAPAKRMHNTYLQGGGNCLLL